MELSVVERGLKARRSSKCIPGSSSARPGLRMYTLIRSKKASAAYIEPRTEQTSHEGSTFIYRP